MSVIPPSARLACMKVGVSYRALVTVCVGVTASVPVRTGTPALTVNALVTLGAA